MDKVIRETGTVVDDGLHEIFVNTVIDDGSRIADLMSCFTKKQVNDPKFPVLSSEVHRLKETEGGTDSMCKVMQHYEEIAEQRGEQRGILKGIQKEKIATARSMHDDGMPWDIITKYTGVTAAQLQASSVNV